MVSFSFINHDDLKTVCSARRVERELHSLDTYLPWFYEYLMPSFLSERDENPSGVEYYDKE